MLANSSSEERVLASASASVEGCLGDWLVVFEAKMLVGESGLRDVSVLEVALPSKASRL